MATIRSEINRLYPLIGPRFLPTCYAQVPENEAFTNRVADLDLFHRKHNQYEVLARWSWNNRCPTELCITDLVNNRDDAHLPTFKQYLLKRLDPASHSKIDVKFRRQCPFYYLRYPLTRLTKKQMLEIARSNGYEGLLRRSWSCWRPVWDEESVSFSPCGDCRMCNDRIIG